MKYVENRMVRLEGRARHYAKFAECAVVDTQGVYTTLAHFLCGENPWGLHQDLRFSLPLTNVLQGSRIVEAAIHTLESGASHIALLDDDYDVLLDVLIAPKAMGRPMPPALARAALQLFQAFDHTTASNDLQTERAPQSQDDET